MRVLSACGIESRVRVPAGRWCSNTRSLRASVSTTSKRRCAGTARWKTTVKSAKEPAPPGLRVLPQKCVRSRIIEIRKTRNVERSAGPPVARLTRQKARSSGVSHLKTLQIYVSPKNRTHADHPDESTRIDAVVGGRRGRAQEPAITDGVSTRGYASEDSAVCGSGSRLVVWALEGVTMESVLESRP